MVLYKHAYTVYTWTKAMQMQCELHTTLPAAGIEPAPAAYAAVHRYTTPTLRSDMPCHKACNRQCISHALRTTNQQSKCIAPKQTCNIHTDAAVQTCDATMQQTMQVRCKTYKHAMQTSHTQHKCNATRANVQRGSATLLQVPQMRTPTAMISSQLARYLALEVGVSQQLKMSMQKDS